MSVFVSSIKEIRDSDIYLVQLDLMHFIRQKENNNAHRWTIRCLL